MLNCYQNIDVELIDCIKYVNKTVEKITTAAYREMAKKAPWAWGKIYSNSQKGPLAHITTKSNIIMAIKLLRLLREKKPDLIISTHPFGSQMCSYLKRKGKITCKLATIMTDFAPHDQWLVGNDFTDYYFVAHDKMKQHLICKGIPEPKIYATGIPISNRFSELHDTQKILNQYQFSDKKQTVLFFGGGEYGLGKTRTTQIFESFVQCDYNLQIIAIAGKNLKMKTTFEEIVKKYNKLDTVKILEFTNEVPELMSIADMVVTKPGGLTTSESLASHLPMILINPIPGQEEENAEFLESKGIAIWIKKSDDASQIIKNLFAHPEKLKTMRKNTSFLAKPNSTKTICDTLLLNLETTK